MVIWKRRGVPALLVTAGLSLLLLVSGDPAQLRVARAVEGIALQPFFRFFGILRGGMTAYGSHREMAERSAEYLRERDLFMERGLENIRLRRLIGFGSRSGFDLLPAEVLRHDAGQLDETIVVSAGIEQGAAVGQPVISPDGLVGRVIEVHHGNSLVRLLRSPANPVSARLLRSRVVGTLRWDPSRPASFDLLHISAHADCEEGDVIVSSGLGGSYPSGLRIGVVSSLDRDLSGLMKEVRIKPAVDFARLEEVFLLKARPGQSDFERLYSVPGTTAPDSTAP